MTLAEFLLARIAEDEADAVQLARDLTRWEHEQAINGPDGTQGSIIAAQLDPARVLAECEAKRRIVEQYLEHDHSAQADHKWSGFDGGYATATDHTLGFLALPFADHPDFDESWRP